MRSYPIAYTTHLDTIISILVVVLCAVQKPILRFLKKLNVCNNMDTLQGMIPETVKLENYVTLRLALRRLVALYLCVVHILYAGFVPPESTFQNQSKTYHLQNLNHSNVKSGQF